MLDLEVVEDIVVAAVDGGQNVFAFCEQSELLSPEMWIDFLRVLVLLMVVADLCQVHQDIRDFQALVVIRAVLLLLELDLQVVLAAELLVNIKHILDLQGLQHLLLLVLGVQHILLIFHSVFLVAVFAVVLDDELALHGAPDLVLDFLLLS